jgi:hypothetical protein
MTEPRRRVVTFVITDDPDMPFEGEIGCAIANGEMIERVIEGDEIHAWFELTYSNYLVLQRSLLQSMPDSWQARFVGCLEELGDAFGHIEHPDHITVHCRTDHGRFTGDPVPHYNRGRTRVDRAPGWSEQPRGRQDG